MKQSVAILGAGAWGSALAHFFASRGFQVFLWCHEDSVAQSINNTRENKFFLKDILLPPKIYATTDMQQILSENVAFVIEAVPVSYLASVCRLINETYALQHYWIVTSKGLDPVTGMHSFAIMKKCFTAPLKAMILSGPSFASEIVKSVPTAYVLAAIDRAVYNLFYPYWETACTKVFFSNDIEGVSLCGALKNVVAVLLGCLNGAGYGKNTQAYLLTIAYEEIKKLVVLCGGQEKTVHGLAGFGDLFLTVSTNVSKNRAYGYLVGQKKTAQEISKQLAVAPEGVSTAAGLCKLFGALSISLEDDFPLLGSVHKILENTQSIDDVVQKFFVR
jgi:glycerol-3-phosphate dehydrogenase (NAD(P)+)